MISNKEVIRVITKPESCSGELDAIGFIFLGGDVEENSSVGGWKG